MNNLSVNTYKLKSTLFKNGVEICDETGGIAKVVEGKEENYYFITINGKKLICPTTSNANEKTFYLRDSLKITLVKDVNSSNLIEIKEISNRADKTYFVDTNNKLVDDIAYDIYNYKPEKIEMESAIKKVNKLLTDNKFFKPLLVLYNRHGIGAFGWNKVKECFGLYYAKPQSEEMKEKRCSQMDRLVNGNIIIKSCKGFVNFRYTFDHGYFLNAERAQRIPMESIVNEKKMENGLLSKTYYLLSTIYNKGVKICDLTGGIVKAEENENQLNHYLITVNGKKLIFPTNSNAYEANFNFRNSETITFEKDVDSNLIKITEIDAKATTNIYVDLNNKPVNGIAYDAYNYMPKEIKKELAINKMIKLVEDNKDFELEVVIYNRHGIGALGWDNSKEYLVFYYSDPQSHGMQPRACKIDRSRVGVHVKSTDGYVNFRCSENKYYLNAEVAQPIPIESIEKKKNTKNVNTSKTYYLNSSIHQNGVEICDMTGGVAKAEEKRENVYYITINKKRLIFPTTSNNYEGTFYLGNSKKITFEWVDSSDLIKITEIDDKAESIFYVDTKVLVFGNAYDLYRHKPEIITKEVAFKKVLKLVEDNKDFKPEIVIYNRHGIGAFGRDEDKKQDVLFYADPQSEEMKNISCSEIGRVRDGGSVIAKSANKSLNFSYLINEGYYLNSEIAERISLESIEKKQTL